MTTKAQLRQQVDRVWAASFQTDLADTLAAHLRQQALVGVQAALEAALLEELDAHRQQHASTAPQRSGSYTRRVLTSHGFIPDLHVPKLRAGNRDRSWQVLRRYHLAMPLLLDQALYLYTLGRSLRDLQEALYVLFGHVLSRSAVNRVTLAAQSPMDAGARAPSPIRRRSCSLMAFGARCLRRLAHSGPTRAATNARRCAGRIRAS